MEINNPGILDASVTLAKLKTAYCQLSTSVAINVPATSFTDLPWDTEVSDTAALHDLVTNPHRITIPTGYTLAIFFASASWTWTTASSTRLLTLFKNGANTSPFYQSKLAFVSASDNVTLFTTPPLVVVPGDFFHVRASNLAAGADSVVASGGGASYFGAWLFG